MMIVRILHSRDIYEIHRRENAFCQTPCCMDSYAKIWEKLGIAKQTALNLSRDLNEISNLNAFELDALQKRTR